MTPVTYTNLNKLLLIRDIQEIAKTYINDDRSYRWIWKNKIAYVYHITQISMVVCLPNIMNVLCMLIFTLVIPTVTKVLLSKDG